jgi:hypothetical protein
MPRPRGQGQNRTADTAVFSRVLCQLSYLAGHDHPARAPAFPARMTGFELAITALTGSTRVLKVTAPSRRVVLAQLERRMAGISLRAIKRLKRRHHELGR